MRAFKAMMSIHEHALDGDGGGRRRRRRSTPDVKLGDLEALRGVVKFPVRIKCATLAWNTLTQALDEVAAASCAFAAAVDRHWPARYRPAPQRQPRRRSTTVAAADPHELVGLDGEHVVPGAGGRPHLVVMPAGRGRRTPAAGWRGRTAARRRWGSRWPGAPRRRRPGWPCAPPAAAASLRSSSWLAPLT